jgi:hypothetical protein
LGTVRLAVKIKNGKRFCVRLAHFIIKLETLLLFFDAVRTTVENSNVKRYFLPHKNSFMNFRNLEEEEENK